MIWAAITWLAYAAIAVLVVTSEEARTLAALYFGARLIQARQQEQKANDH